MHTTKQAHDAEVTRLYKELIPAATKLAAILSGDDHHAHDIAHDAFIRVMAKRNDLTNPDALRAYLRTAVVRQVSNEQRSWFRRKNRQERATLGEPTVTTPHPHADDRIDMIRALHTLPAKQRIVLVLTYWHDLPDRDIHHATGYPIGTIKSLRSRGLTALKERVGHDRIS